MRILGGGKGGRWKGRVKVNGREADEGGKIMEKAYPDYLSTPLMTGFVQWPKARNVVAFNPCENGVHLG